MQTPIRKAGKYTFPKVDNYLTQAKLSELDDKLKRLKLARPRLAEEVKRLSELGDFSENAAYAMAKGRLRSLNQKILDLEAQVKRAILITPPAATGTVQLGCTVTVEHLGQQTTYRILGSAESNPSRGIISQNSPIGSMLMGKKIGDRVQLQLPNATVEYVVRKIE